MTEKERSRIIGDVCDGTLKLIYDYGFPFNESIKMARFYIELEYPSLRKEKKKCQD